VLLAATLAGCGGEGPAAPPSGLGTVRGRWDGAAWDGRGYAVLHGNTLHLVGHRPDPRSFYEELVRARVPFRGVAAYQVGADAASLEQITGGDAGYLPSATGELRVTDYHAGTDRVRGTLWLVSANPHLPWRFEDGTFHVPVYARWEDVPPVRAR